MTIPLVTVAVPVFNGARYLAECLDSLLRQSHRDFRLIIVDDCSSDDSLPIACSFDDPRVQVLQNSVRRGLAGNWNRAMELASTPYALIAHQDDRYDEAFLATMLQLLESHPRAFAAHSLAQSIDAGGHPLATAASRFKERFWPADEPYERTTHEELSILERGNYVICPSVLYRVAAVHTIGPFNERYSFVPDWEYWLRGVLAGYTLTGTHRRLMQWRRHDATATVRQEITRRFDEEFAVLEWLSRTAQSPLRLAAVKHTLLHEFAEYLASGDGEAAKSIAAHAAKILPRSSPARWLIRTSLPMGSMGGKALRGIESLYVSLARPLA